MVEPVSTLHRLAKLNYFRHPPDFVVVGGDGFVGSYVCRVAAKCGFIPVSISPNCCPPVYGEINEHENSWITKVHWREGNAVKPSTWDPHVVEAGCTAMIYTTKPSYYSSKLLWECNYEGALQSIEMARKMHANRFVYISTNFLPPVVTSVERQTKKLAEEALFEYSRMSLPTDSPIQLSILKPGWVYGNDRFFSSLIGLSLHRLFDPRGSAHPPRNLSSISVSSLAIAALCQALDPSLPDFTKLPNDALMKYAGARSVEWERWLRQQAEKMLHRKQASRVPYDFEAF